jgi:2'-5' RNA ligase
MTALVLIPAPTPPLPDEAHLTLVWAGERADQSVLSQLRFMGRSFARQQKAFPVKVLGTAMFGENHNEPVLLIELASQIAIMRSAVQQYSKSEYTEFRPHVAVPSLNGHRFYDNRLRPLTLYFNQIALWPTQNYGEDADVWWLGQ